MSAINTMNTLATLESYLELTTAREHSVSANMANVDTPGYRTHDINFQSELHKAVNLTSLETTGGTPGLHLAPVVRDVQGLMERPDGNNVSLDREGLLMAETQLQYQVGVQLIKGEFHQILSAINGGN
jgi:flagellar basal-body rod protein FlgB